MDSARAKTRSGARFLARDRSALEGFEREARAASVLNQPSICTIYEIAQHDDRPFLAMEFRDGRALKHRISRQPMATELVLELGLRKTPGVVGRKVQSAGEEI
jgi:serine/threonine protein kinase